MQIYSHELGASSIKEEGPQALPVLLERIPKLLKNIPNWVLWRYERTCTKWAKVPYHPKGYRASSTNNKTWSRFDVVARCYERSEYSGIGIVLDGKPLDESGRVLAAVDIDKVVGDPDREDLAQDIIRDFSSYTELSPSGTGYRIFCLAKPLGRGGAGNGIEVYTAGRYMTVTGHRIEVEHV